LWEIETVVDGRLDIDGWWWVKEDILLVRAHSQKIETVDGMRWPGCGGTIQRESPSSEEMFGGVLRVDGRG
jgi:hypothetical protein